MFPSFFNFVFFRPNHAWISQNPIWNLLDGFILFDIHAVAAFWTDSRRGWNTGMCVSGDFVPILLRSQSILIYYVLKLQESKGDYWNLPLMSGSDYIITPPPSTSGSEATWFTTPLLIVAFGAEVFLSSQGHDGFDGMDRHGDKPRVSQGRNPGFMTGPVISLWNDQLY